MKRNLVLGVFLVLFLVLPTLLANYWVNIRFEIKVSNENKQYKLKLLDKGSLGEFLGEIGFKKSVPGRMGEKVNIKGLDLILTSEPQRSNVYLSEDNQIYQSTSYQLDRNWVKLYVHQADFVLKESLELNNFRVINEYILANLCLLTKSNGELVTRESCYKQASKFIDFKKKNFIEIVRSSSAWRLVKPVYANCAGGDYECGSNVTTGCTCSISGTCSYNGQTCGYLGRGTCSGCTTTCDGQSVFKRCDTIGTNSECTGGRGACSSFDCVVGKNCTWTSAPPATPVPPTSTPVPQPYCTDSCNRTEAGDYICGAGACPADKKRTGIVKQYKYNPATGGCDYSMFCHNVKDLCDEDCCTGLACNSFSDIKFGSCDSSTKWTNKDPSCFTNSRSVTFTVANGGSEQIRYGVVGTGTDCSSLPDGSFSGWQANTGSLTIQRSTDGEFKVCIQRKPNCNETLLSPKCGAMVQVDSSQPACSNGAATPASVRWTAEQNGNFRVTSTLTDNYGFNKYFIGCLWDDGSWHNIAEYTADRSLTTVNVDKSVALLPECKTRMNNKGSTVIFVTANDLAGNSTGSPINNNCHSNVTWVEAEKPMCSGQDLYDPSLMESWAYFPDVYHGANVNYWAGSVSGSGWQQQVRRMYISSSGTQVKENIGSLGSATVAFTVNRDVGTSLQVWTHLIKPFSDGSYSCNGNPVSTFYTPAGTVGPPNNAPGTACTNTCQTKTWGVCYQQYNYDEARQDAINTYCNDTNRQNYSACPAGNTWKNPMKCHISKNSSGAPNAWGLGHFDWAKWRCVADNCECVCEPPLDSPLPVPVCLSPTVVRIGWTAISGAGSYNLRINEEPLSEWAGANDTAVVVTGTSVDRTIVAGKTYSINLQSIKPGETYPYTAAQNPSDIRNGVIFNCGQCPDPGTPQVLAPSNSCLGSDPTAYTINQSTAAESSCFPWDASARIKNNGNNTYPFQSLRSLNAGVLSGGGMNYSFTSWQNSSGAGVGIPSLGTGDYTFMSTVYNKSGVASGEASGLFSVDKTAPSSPTNLVATNSESCETWKFDPAVDVGCGGISKYRVQCNSRADYLGTNYCTADIGTTSYDLGALPCNNLAITAGSTVYCRVYAVDGVGLTSAYVQNSCTSAIGCVTGAPEATSVVSPLGTQSNPVVVSSDPIVLTWNKSNDSRTDAYNIGTWTLAGGEQRLNEVDGVDATTTSREKLLYTPGVTYKWQLQTINSCLGREVSSWSAPGYFVVPTVGPTTPPCVVGKPNITTILSPLGNSTSPVVIDGDTVEFRWNKSNDSKTDAYRIGVWDPSPSKEQYIFNVDGVGTTLFGESVGTFGVGTTYHWQIQTLNTCAGTEPSDWSTMVGYFVIPKKTVATSFYVRGRVWWDKNEDFMRRNTGSTSVPIVEPMLTDDAPDNFTKINITHNCGLNETMKSSLWNTCSKNDGLGPFTSSWISKSWVGGDCTLTAKIDTDVSPGWYFPEYTRTDSTKGPDFRRHFPSMIDYVGMPYDEYASACLTWWVNDSSRMRGTCLSRDGSGRCIESRVTVPYSGEGNISDPDVGTIQVVIPVNGPNMPFYKNLTLKNVEGTVVPVDANGTDNHICEDEFRSSVEPRKVRFEVTVGDYDGYDDINKVDLRYNGVTYPMTFVSGAGTEAVYRTDQTFPTSSPIGLSPISIYVEDDGGQSNNWLPATNRNLKVWNCQVSISGTLYDGSDAPFGIPNCATGVGLSKPYEGGYGLTYFKSGGAVSGAYEAVYGGANKTMNVSGADYNSSSQDLVWGESYSADFSGLAGGDPTMCVGAAQAVNVNTKNVNAYSPTAMEADFSAVVDQGAWYQVEGGNIRAREEVTNKVPTTCTPADNCISAMTVSQAMPPMTNGMVQAPVIENNSGCSLDSGNCTFGSPNNWYWDVALPNDILGYDYWYDQLVVKNSLAQVVGTGVSWSTSGITTGIVLIDGNLTIDTNNDLSGSQTLMVVVKGNVEVLPTVTSWEGILVADGSIIVSGASPNQLRMGGVYYSATDSILISRTYEDMAANNVSPAVVFSYQPGLVFNLPATINRVISGFNSN